MKAKLYVVQPVLKKNLPLPRSGEPFPKKSPSTFLPVFFQRFTPVFSITAQFLQVVEIEGIYISAETRPRIQRASALNKHCVKASLPTRGP